MFNIKNHLTNRTIQTTQPPQTDHSCQLSTPPSQPVLPVTQVTQNIPHDNPYLTCLCPDPLIRQKLPESLLNLTQKEFSKIISLPIRQIPKELLTEDICIGRMRRNPDELLDIPKDRINDAIRLTAVKNHGMVIQHIENKNRNHAIRIAAVTQNGFALQNIEREFKETTATLPELDQDAILDSTLITKSQLDELRIIAVNQIGFALNMIDKKDRNPKLEAVALASSNSAIKIIPESRRTEEVCWKVVSESPHLLQYVPLEKKSKALCLMALSQGRKDNDSDDQTIEYVPSDVLDDEIIITALVNNPASLKFLGNSNVHLENPAIQKALIEQFGSIENFFIKGIKIRANIIFAIPEKYYQEKFLIEAIKQSKDILEELPHLADAEKWCRLAIPDDIYQAHQYEPEITPLFNTLDTPLASVVSYYHELKLIQDLAHTTLTIDSPVYDDLATIKQHCDSASTPSLDHLQALDATAETRLASGVRFGGRTLKNHQHYFKFWKEKEPFPDFILEPHTVHYLQQKKEALGLLSEIPESLSISKLAETLAINARISSFKDKPQRLVDPQTGQGYYIIYHYTASDDYSIFAHQRDTTSETPYKKAHDGLFKGIHDVGRLAKHGIVYTNTLPAFHNLEGDREWILMGQLFTEMTNPGTLRSWCTQATEFPDFGYSGLRDYGDFALLGKIPDYIHRDYERSKDHITWLSGQKMSLYNALDENILATILLYARLHREDETYHHTSEDAIKNAEWFIETTLHFFLRGILQDSYTSFHQLINIPEKDYKKWLRLSSERLLYWTEKQGTNRDCYTTDILLNEKFNPKIYPNSSGVQDQSIRSQLNIHPEIGFVNPKGEPDLGGTNRVFPLMNLVEGLALMNRRLEALDHTT